MESTITDICPDLGEVTRLRLWGTEDTFTLPESTSDLTIGAAPSCSITLQDPTQRVSRLHARLWRREGVWWLHDLSKNGVRCNGRFCREFALVPGTELGCGGLTLIVESRKTIELRAFLARILGFTQLQEQERALRMIHLAARRMTELSFYADFDSIPVAQAIHRRTLGAERPFVVCDPRREEVDADVRCPINKRDLRAACDAARGGALCVRNIRLPDGFETVLEELRDPSVGIGLVVVFLKPERHHDYLGRPISIPSISERAPELDQIITEYATDASIALCTERKPLTAKDHAWVRAHSAQSLNEIEKGTLRLTAIRSARTITAAAKMAGCANVSLVRWAKRHRLTLPWRSQDEESR